MQKPFTPIKLTERSLNEQLQEKILRKDVEKLCDILTQIKIGFDGLLTGFEDSCFQITSDFLKATNPAEFIKQKFVEAKNIKVPGIKESALIEGDLLDIPQEALQTLLEDRKSYDLLLKNVIERFSINIKDFYFEEDGSGLFAVGEKFEQVLNDYYSAETSNEIENEIIEALQNFVDSVNALMRLGIVKRTQNWIDGLKFGPRFFPLTPNNENPLSLSRHAIDIARTFSRPLIAKQNAEQAAQVTNAPEQAAQVDNTPEQAEPDED